MKFVPLLPNDELPEGKSKVVKARSIKVCVCIYVKKYAASTGVEHNCDMLHNQ
jgi:hypothetical protein